ncbi:MAG: SRPBCC domain-containing protein [Novosphingobium sp.]
MELKFRVWGRIARPVENVFEAVVNPDRLSQYFTTGGATGRLEKGATVTWDFADFPGAFPVEVVELVENKLILLHWGNAEGNGTQTEVTMRFTDCDDGHTLVEIGETGWSESQQGLDASYGNCMGWSQMICTLRIWIEHGINLREGFYK